MRHYELPKYQARNIYEKMLGRFVAYGYSVSPVGSRAIVGGTKRGSDWDVLVYGKDAELELTTNGFEPDTGSEVPEGKFVSYSKTLDYQRVNFIVAKTQDFYDSFLAATTLCVNAKVIDKGCRVAIHNHLNGVEVLTNSQFENCLKNNPYVEVFPDPVPC